MQMTHPNFTVTTLGKEKKKLEDSICCSTAVFKVSSHFAPTVIFYPNAVDSYPSLSWFVPKLLVNLHMLSKYLTQECVNRCQSSCMTSQQSEVRSNEQNCLVYMCTRDSLNQNNLIIAQHKASMILFTEKSIVYTCDFFNNNSLCKCNTFHRLSTWTHTLLVWEQNN